MTDQTRQTTERTVIGCMLIDTRSIDTLIAAGGDRAWFTDPQAARVAACILDRYETGKVASDTIAICAASSVQHEWLDGCTDLVPTIAHTSHYVGLLKGHAKLDALNALVKSAGHLVRTATAETVDEASAGLEALVHGALGQDDDQSAGTVKQAAHDWLDRMTAPDSETTLLDWWCREITEAVGRVDRELIWLIAQPSVGKTAAVIQWMQTLAPQGHMTSLAALESGIESIASRMVSSGAPMNTEAIRQRRATPDEIAKARAAADDLSALMSVTDTSMTLDQVYAWGRAEKRKGSKMLIIDNTRHVRVDGNDSRADKMAAISARMKQLRDDTDLPVVVLHHSKKDKDGGEGISWSADIEKDADVVAFLREVEDKCEAPSQTNRIGRWCVALDFAKVREGRKKVRVVMEFEKHHQRFVRWLDDPLAEEVDQFNSEPGEQPLWEDVA